MANDPSALPDSQSIRVHLRHQTFRHVGFITGMNDLLIPKLKADFNLTQLQATLV